MVVVAKMLFPQVDEGFWLYYTSVWYKNIQANIVLFNFALIGYKYILAAELRKS